MADETPSRAEPFNAQTRMAAQRTFVAYIRTGLATMSLGFVIARFNVFLWKSQHGKGFPVSSPWEPMWLGLSLTVFGVVINVIATIHHFRLMSQADRGEPYRPEKWTPDMLIGAGMVALGLAIVIDLFISR